ncbi:hypothetical protein BC828DRAFT_200328 [Blastocladiella britannica]|nr:hypothetical protein BC828DRAFT_200328 [Blastocladiella britannica]
MADFYGYMGGAHNPELDQRVAAELEGNPAPTDDEKAKKRPWHRRLNRAVDKVLTHPIVEAGKAAGRFVPGVGIFMIGVDRLTKWKLTYSNNVNMVAMLEKKMTDITVTYIALVELLPPKDRRDDNPRLRIFAKRAEQVKRLVGFIQKSIDDYEAKNEKERLALAEVIQSSFSSLQRTLDELQRDIVLHLGMQSAAGITAQGTRMDAIVDVLSAQRSILERQGDRNERLVALMGRQIDAADHMKTMLSELRDELVPGYAKVENREITRVWWDFFRWPACLPTGNFVAQMPQYFKTRRDLVALQMWTNLQSGNLIELADLGLDSNGMVSPLDLNEAFPSDPVYEITLGDWLAWKGLGWYDCVFIHPCMKNNNAKKRLYLAVEIERSLLPYRSRLTQSSTLISRFITYLSDLLLSMRRAHGYTGTVHARLLSISNRIVSSSLPSVPDRFQALLDGLSDASEMLDNAANEAVREWMSEERQEYFSQELATLQWRLAAAAEELGAAASTTEDTLPDLWPGDDLTAWTAQDRLQTSRALAAGQHFAGGLWGAWNGCALVPPEALEKVTKLGRRTLAAVLHGVQPVVMRPIAVANKAAPLQDAEGADTLLEPELVTALEATGRAAAQWNSCGFLARIHGVTLVAGCWMAVIEYCERGDARTAIAFEGAEPLAAPDSEFSSLVAAGVLPAPRRVTLGTKLRVMAHVAAGLGFMHACGTAHGRLMTASVLVTESMGAKLAGTCPSAADPGEQLAIAQYSAPELVLADPLANLEHDALAADVFSMGQIFAELLTCVAPLCSTPSPATGKPAAPTSIPAVVAAMQHYDPAAVTGVMPAGLPQDLVDLISGMVARDPVDRPKLAEVRSTLESVLARFRQQLAPHDATTTAPVAADGFAAASAPPSYQDVATLGRRIASLGPNSNSNPPVDDVAAGLARTQLAEALSRMEELKSTARGADPTDLAARGAQIERTLLHISPDLPRALFHLGDLYYYDHTKYGIPHDFRRALDAYSQATVAGDALAAVGVADCHYFGHGGIARQPGVARDLYERASSALVVDPPPVGAVPVPQSTRARVYAGLGDVNWDQSGYVAALDHYHRATEVDPACARAWARIGDAYLYGRGTRSGQVDMALAKQCYNKAKGSRRGTDGMVEFYRVRGDLAFANLYMNDAAKMAPDH